MSQPQLTIHEVPPLTRSTLLVALTGWMDGGEVSTGTVRGLMDERELVHVASISPAGFYIDSFPGSMEIAALFRPHVKYAGGLMEEFDMAENDFHADVANNIAFFIGREPNLNWIGFGDCIFEVAKKLNVERIIFMGSFGGSVPHTREPRLFGSVSDPSLLPVLKEHGLRPSDYEGPASFATYLLKRAPIEGMQMISIAAEIPGYLQGLNPLSIEAVIRRLAHLMRLNVDLSVLRKASTAWELQVTEAIEKDENLAGTVHKLEEQYDNDLIAREN